MLKKLNDSRSLRILGRDHANAILSGASSSQTRKTLKSIPIGKHKLWHEIYNFFNSLCMPFLH